MTPYQLKKTADDFEIPYKGAVKMRLRYLYNQLDQGIDWICGDADMPEIMPDECIEEITRLSASLKRAPVASRITDEMIQRAREYPIENLIEFIRGKAIAWCHDDKTPSLSHYRKANIATCFPCGKSYDSIAVLMERDSQSFKDAVLKLQI